MRTRVKGNSISVMHSRRLNRRSEQLAVLKYSQFMAHRSDKVFPEQKDT